MLVYMVQEIETERGWGSKIEDVYYFPSEEIAKDFCKKYDEEYNTSTTVPDWYMYQSYSGTKIVNSKEDFDKHVYKGSLVNMPKWEYE